MELARHRGLKVTALASAHDELFLCSRGADHFLPRDAALPSTAFAGIVDAAVPGQESAPNAESGSTPWTYVPTAPSPPNCPGWPTKAPCRPAWPGPSLPLADSAAARSRLAEGGLRGRIVIMLRLPV
ncbi:hypothetical protein FB563_0376 [Streptomyces puniciscabiei]|uniref:Uncharacterized protein n=1 Tax=Streptomyces puniciscabiei TaxID=164348 RepID=A0A542U8S7_9ACTN|nr:hypothetical protein FB563_0376 [Streptomyces puniciscabiei]